MNDDLPDPGGPCSRYPLRYGIPFTFVSLAPCRGEEGRTSVRIPPATREERAQVLGDALRDATRKHDAAQRAPAAGQPERAPIGAPRGVHDEAPLLPTQCGIAGLREQRGEQRAVARERRQRDRLPRRAGRHLHRARLALALHLRSGDK